MDNLLIPIDKIYDAIIIPAKRRKIFVRKRETSDPKAVQNARSLGQTLFGVMGPDGEDSLFIFLQSKLKYWQDSVRGYKALADTGEYPGKEDIKSGLALIDPLIVDKDSKRFLERFNALEKDLLDWEVQFHDIVHFYEKQKPTWERLRGAHTLFRQNQLELVKDVEAKVGLERMQEILSAPNPYGLIKEVEALINGVETVNTFLLSRRRADAVVMIDGRIATLTKDIAAVQADAALRATCLQPLEALRQRVERETSLAHIDQAETAALQDYDAALKRIEEFGRKQTDPTESPQPPAVKRQRVVKPADFVKTAYLETPADAKVFLDALGKEIQDAIANNERIQIR